MRRKRSRGLRSIGLERGVAEELLSGFLEEGGKGGKSPMPSLVFADSSDKIPCMFQVSRRGQRENFSVPSCRRFFLRGFLVFAVLWCGTAGNGYSQETVVQFFDRAEAAYRNLKDYVAEWYIQIGGVSSQAVAYYKTPGKLLLEYSEPKGRFILITGENLIIYNKRNNILMTQELTDSPELGPPSLRLMRNFYSMRFKYPSGAQPRRIQGIETSVIVVLMTPIHSAFRTEELEVSFYGSNLLIRQIKGVWYGQTVQYDFMDIRTNSDLSDSIFTPPEPPGSKEWSNFLQN